MTGIKIGDEVENKIINGSKCPECNDSCYGYSDPVFDCINGHQFQLGQFVGMRVKDKL